MIIIPGDWVILKNIPNGSLFETKEMIRAVKTKYYNGRKCLCILLSDGGYSNFEEIAEVRLLQIGWEIK